MKDSYLFGLPALALNLLSSSLSILIVCLGVRVATAPELSFDAMNTQLVVSEGASQLTDLSTELSKQAETMKIKDEAYSKLLATYEQSLKGKEGYGKLQAAIETIESLPSPDNIDVIQEGIQETELDLNEKLAKKNTIRICCKVTPGVLRVINRLSTEQKVSHQQVVFDLITAQIEGVNIVQKKNQASLAALYRCQLKIAEIDEEVTRLIEAFYSGGQDD